MSLKTSTSVVESQRFGAAFPHVGKIAQLKGWWLPFGLRLSAAPAAVAVSVHQHSDLNMT